MFEHNAKPWKRKIHSVLYLCPVYTYPDSFVSANILLRIQKFTRPHVSGFVAFSTVHTYLRKRYESDSNSLELLREHALSEITSPRCRLPLAILTRVSKFCLCLKVNMSNSTEKSNKSKSTNKKSQAEPFVWTDDEVDLLFSVVLEYKVSRTSENVDWETCQSKYSDILELFHAQYPSRVSREYIG